MGELLSWLGLLRWRLGLGMVLWLLGLGLKLLRPLLGAGDGHERIVNPQDHWGSRAENLS